MARYRGKHRKQPTAGRNIARMAVAGAVVAAPMALAAPANAADWDSLAECESSGDWTANTGNGYYGGLQFDPSTWSAYGGDEHAANANDASREQQIEIAEKVLDAQGANAWPGCTEQQDWTSGSTEDTTESTPDEEATYEVASAEEQPAEEQQEQVPTQAPEGDYTVQVGDTLGKIGEKFGVDHHSVFEQNADLLEDPNMIFPGQQLSIS